MDTDLLQCVTVTILALWGHLTPWLHLESNPLLFQNFFPPLLSHCAILTELNFFNPHNLAYKCRFTAWKTRPLAWLGPAGRPIGLTRFVGGLGGEKSNVWGRIMNVS